MTGGKAHGANRQYQIECRDVLIHRKPELTPWTDDGVDIPFKLPDTTWTIDVALRDPSGSLVVAECKRRADGVKQDEVAAFAHKVERLRKALGIAVAGVFMAKSAHQIGAVRVGQFEGIKMAILDEGSSPPGFNITFLRYDQERETKLRDITMSVECGSYRITGTPAAFIHRNASGEEIIGDKPPAAE
jgi:hypothetical protein